MASLQHLDGDRWRVRVYAGLDDDGRERLVSRSFRATGERAAKKMAAKIETDLRDGIEAAEAIAAERRGSVRELMEDWLDIKRRDASPSTMRQYDRHATKIIAQFGPMPAARLTGRDIDRWYSGLMADGMTEAGIQHLHRVLRAALRWAHKKRDLPIIATDKASPPSHRSPELQPPSNEAVRNIVRSMPNAEWARAVALLIFVGCRRGEVVGLRWDDIAPGRLTIRHSIVEVPGKPVAVRPPKGRRSRDVAIDEAADLVLQLQRDRLETAGVVSPWVFPDLITDATGQTPRRPGWVSLMWGKHRSGLGASTVRLHSLRHHYATTLLDGGTPLNTVQKWLGHSEASTTLRIYGHRTDEGEAVGLSVMRKALASPESPAP